MRIAIVSVHEPNLHVAGLSAALSRAGHQVTLYTRRNGGEVAETDGYATVRVAAGPARRLADDRVYPHLGDFAQFLTTAWGADPPDVVHSHSWMSGLVAVLGARRTGTPIVHTCHGLGGGDDAGPSERATIERLVGREVDHVVATCSDEVFELIRMGVPRSKAVVVPSGVDLDVFTPNGPRAGRGARFRAVFAGGLSPRGGIGTALTALSKVDDCELVVTGESVRGQVKQLKASARELGVAERVRYLGELPPAELPALLRSANAVVCPPLSDPSGIVALEAMGCGVPVVATAVGGLTDAVIHGVTGFLVPPGDPDALARRLRALLADDTRRQELGAAGFDRVCARYSWDRIAQDVLRVYERAGATPEPAVSAAASPR